MVCVFIPEEKDKCIQSVQLIFTSKRKGSEELIKFGHLWKKILFISNSEKEIGYKYRIKVKSSWLLSRISQMVPPFYKLNDKIEDTNKRSMSLDLLQRDIFSENKFTQDDSAGIVAHVKEILENPNKELIFGELDNLMSRNKLSPEIRNAAFHSLLHTGQMVTQEECLLLLYSFQREYVTKDIKLKNDVASQIWEQVQQLDKKYYEMCVNVARDLLHIHKTSRGMSNNFLNFIKEGQFFLSATAVYNILQDESHSCICNCPDSFLDLKTTLQFIFNQDADSEQLKYIIYSLFCAHKTNILITLLNIISEIIPLDKNIKCLEEFRQYLLENATNELSKTVRGSNFSAAKEFILKVNVDLKPKFVLHCENEILKHIKKVGFCENVSSEFESVYKNMFFERKDQQLLLLKVLLKVPDKQPRSLLKDILLQFESNDAKGEIDTLKEAFNVLFDSSTVCDTKETFLEFDILVGKAFFRIAQESFQTIFESHLSKKPTESLCALHTDVEKLSNLTNDIYCRILKKKLKFENFGVKSKWIEENGSDVTTRGKAEVFISALESYDIAENLPYEEGFHYAIANASVWKHILGVTGKYKYLVVKHPFFLWICENYRALYSNLQNDMYDYSFLQKFKCEMKNEESIIDVFGLVVTDSKTKIHDTLTKATNIFERAQKELKLMNNVLTKVSSALQDSFHGELTKCSQYLEKIEIDLEQGKLKFCDFKTLDIFENGNSLHEQSLLQNCKYLERFVTFSCFWRSTDALFKNDMTNILGEKKQRSFKQNTQILLGFLVSTCIPKFIENMRQLWDLNISIPELYHMFWRNDFTVENMCAEINLIANVLSFSTMTKEKEATFKRCLDLKGNLAKISAIKRFQTVVCSKLDDKHERQFKELEDIHIRHAESKLTLLHADYFIKDMESSILNFSEEVIDVMNEYATSQNLVYFLNEIKSEDIRNLMDAMEGDYFDQYLPLVSHLVEVKDLLLPVIELGNGADTVKYASQIEASLKKTEIQMAAVKVALCSRDLDSLKNFYKAFANKSERTKDRIENILSKGSFYFKLGEQESKFEIHCTDGTNHTASDLSDLRSRALLIQNRFEKKGIQTVSLNVTQCFSKFLEKVDAATDILETFHQLKILGHPLFETIDTNVQFGDLEKTKVHLSKTCDEWRDDLTEFRRKYTCLKYIKSEQLQLLFRFFREKVEQESNIQNIVRSLLWFIHPDLDLTIAKENGLLCDDSSPRSYLESIARYLEGDFENLKLTRKSESFPLSMKAETPNLVIKMKINFLCLDKDSGIGFNLLLSLFQIKCDSLPLPNEVIVCQKNTSWDEIYLMLLRCRDESNTSNKCFCIAFLELLPTEYQGMLLNEIENFEGNQASLFLIYRGRSTDPIPTFFNDFQIFVKPLDRQQMECLIQTVYPDTIVFTSESPGLGKTEEIFSLAASQEKGIKSLHVSGVNQRSQLIQRLINLKLKPYEILHIEIGLIDDQKELEIFLFELLFLRYVSYSSLSYVLPETTVAVEITNGPNQMTTDCLPFLMCFSRKHLKWENYDNFKSERVLNSPVQVVCGYLRKIESKEINSDIDISQTSLLSERKCQGLLRKYFPSFDGINFNIVNVFVSVLSNQLKKLSASSYFQQKNLSLMIGEENIISVKTHLVDSLILFSKEFASKKISCKDSKQTLLEKNYSTESNLKLAVKNLATRTQGMLRWEQSNHLIVVFHSQDTKTVSIVYRSLELVPQNIKDMFKSQVGRDLPNFVEMKSEEILNTIVKIVRSKQKQLSKEKMLTLAKSYAYTPDNMLKMIMIALRIQSNIPVVVMGETGCGKTSLVRKLADICDVHLDILSVHAGIEKRNVLDAVRKTNNIAVSNRAEDVWMFFDEINTSQDVGLISDIVCHRKIDGKELSPNLCFIAACNPYRLRDSHQELRKGIMVKLSEDALSILAYRVHPLPEMMLDFVWDYGSLPLEEEKAYIKRMVDFETFNIHDKILIELLATSQGFVREKEKSSCTVSLRDVHRCIQLIKWFKDQFIPKQHPSMEDVRIYQRSFIMGLAVCYLCRFASSKDRLAYRERLAAVFTANFIDKYSEEEIDKCIKEEHGAILKKMVIPSGIAKNFALSENIFVMLVCILNRLPLFIVGKPGCSKSLSMQLIRNNMRGKDSNDVFFQGYPRLFYSSFQGSESSTSDGIIKVFERAKKIEKQDSDVLSLVILDEIGLAEISRFNPLKVLHSLLEPEGKDRPEVAVVGISNWTLDPAKMNRAIHLSRPDMDEDDLFTTGQSIMNSVVDQSTQKSFQQDDTDKRDKAKHQELYNTGQSLMNSDLNPSTINSILKDVAKAYLDYTKKQKLDNFHGLRDYYSFIKFISRKFKDLQNSEGESDISREKNIILLKGLQRNFGGQGMDNDTMKMTFLNILHLHGLPFYDTTELIKENIVDSESRHLMLILDGDSALGSIENTIQDLGKDLTIILGSRFSDDQDEDYRYRILNRIILCMEQPQVLILKDLDDVYGSLYDMLNQNYTIVQGRKHCRVALGPYSNPTCEVHSDFKCIVIVDESVIDNTDPPFLNRFEKQLYFLRDILKPKYSEIAGGLKTLVKDLMTYKQTNILFCPEDAFPIAGRDTWVFSTLVAMVEQKLEKVFEKEITETQVIFYCITELLWILKPDCILRADVSTAFEKSRDSVEFLLTEYMNLPIHNGLKYYLEEMCLVENNALRPQIDGSKHVEKELLKRVPFELKELIDCYFKDVKNDVSVYDELIQYSEHEDNLPNPENIDSVVDSSDEFLENSETEFDISKFTRSYVRRQRQQLLRRSDGFGAQFVVFTYSTVYCKIQDDVAKLNGSLYKLSDYKSEKTFTKDIETFFEISGRKMLVLQCDMKSDYRHILLAKSVLENTKKRFARNDVIKHMCIVIHVKRSSCPLQMFNKINFSTGWTIATLDSVENPTFSLPDVYKKSVLDVFNVKEQEFGELIFEELSWASARIQYQGILNTITDVNELKNSITDVNELKNSNCAVHFLSNQIQDWIRRHCVTQDNMDWQHKAAFDKHLLDTSTTIMGTIKSHLSSLIQEPLARIMFAVEKAGIMGCLLTLDELNPDLKHLFQKGCEFTELYDIDAVPPPTGPGCYIINLSTQTKIPFSKLMFENVEKYKAEVLGDVRRANIIPGIIQDAENQELKDTMFAIARTYSDLIRKEAFLLDLLQFDDIKDELRFDFYLFATSTLNCRFNREEKIGIMKWIFDYLIRNTYFTDASTFLTTLNLWIWTYHKNIFGIFYLLDFCKTSNMCEDVLSLILQISENRKTLLESLQSLVDSTSEDMLRKCEILDKNSMITWEENVFKFMAIIGEIGIASCKTETLKFFTDFISIVFLQNDDVNSVRLNEFAVRVSYCGWELKKYEVFKELWHQLKLMNNESVSSLKLQQTACSYVLRCNGFCDDSDIDELQRINLEILSLIEKGEMFDETLRFYGHCLKLSLFDYFPESDERIDNHLFFFMLQKEQHSDEPDNFLEKLHNVLNIGTMPSFPALFISILEERAFNVITVKNLAAISISTDFFIQMMFQAHALLKNECHGLRYYVAVAYLRKFLSVTASLISLSQRNTHVCSAIDKLLCLETEISEQKEMQKYFINCLKRNVGDKELFRMSSEMSETMQFFRMSTMLPTLENVSFSIMSLNLARYCEKDELLSLLSQKIMSSKSMERIVKGESIASLLCALHNRIYYSEAFSKVSDADHLFGKSVENCSVACDDDNIKRLIKHLVNQHSCDRNILKQTAHKSPESTSLTTFLFHLISLILIKKKKTSVLYKAAIHHEAQKSKIPTKGLQTPFKIQNCSCNHRIIAKENHNCPRCPSVISNDIAISFTTPLKQNPFSAIVREILIDGALVTSCLFQDLVSEVGIREVEYREKNLETNWKSLRTFLQVNDCEQCELLIIFMEDAREIFSEESFSQSEWNSNYDIKLKRLFENRYQVIRENKMKHGIIFGHLNADSYNKSNDVESNDSLFCLHENPSIENLHLQLSMSGSEEKFPCLAMILGNLQLLPFPQYIVGILQWHRMLITKCKYSLKKVDCNYISAGAFINQQNKTVQRDLRKSFKIFCDTWEKIIPLISTLERHSTKLPHVEKVTDDSIMDMCVLKNKTSVVFQVLQALCSVQNNLLDKALGTCVKFKSKALGFLQLGTDKAAIPVVALMDLHTKQIIKSITENKLEDEALFSQCKCTNETRELEYDFRKIEIEWAFKMFYNKAHILIDENMMFMEFKDDLYGNCVQLLQKVSAFIPQSRIGSTTETKIRERLENDPSQVPQLLTIIGTITTIICRRRENEGSLHIADFAEKLEKLQLLGLSKYCLSSYLTYDLPLNKVVAFYTILEEINGETYFSALDTEFRGAIPDQIKTKITSELNGRITLLKACESAMHIFLHRHLYIRDNDISLQQPLADYLASPELWKDAHVAIQKISIPEIEFEILLQDVFPHELLIMHVYKFVELLKEQIKVHQMRTQIPVVSNVAGRRQRRTAMTGIF